MAALADATAVSAELLELTRELRRHVNGADADFRTMAFVADAIGELADVLASTFAEVDAVLTLASFATDAGAGSAVQVLTPEPVPADVPASREQGRAWLTHLLRPARWLGRRLRHLRRVFRSRAPSERPEFA